MGMTMTQKILAAHAGLPSVKAGRSILVNWEKLMEYLDNHTLTPSEPESKIRRISA